MTITTGTGDEWSYTWNDLPVYQNSATAENPAKSTYYVVETSVPYRYTVSYNTDSASAVKLTRDQTNDDVEVTNTYEPKLLWVKTHKVWEDNSNKYGTRPATIQMTLQWTTAADPTEADWKAVEKVTDGDRSDITKVYTSSDATQTIQVNTAVDTQFWACEWNDVNMYVSGGQKVKFRIVETDLNNYTATVPVIDDTQDGIMGTTEYVVNTIDTVELEITKTWDIKGVNGESIMPDAVNAHLEYRLPDETEWHTFANGVGNVTLTADSAWYHKFTDLPKDYVYRVVEDSIVYGEITVNASGRIIGNFTVTGGDAEADGNGLKAQLANELNVTALTVAKRWNDEDNRDGDRPASITVQLKRDGEVFGSAVTLSADDWTYEWNNLPIYKNGSSTEKPRRRSISSGCSG